MMSDAIAGRDEIRETAREYILVEFLPDEDPAALTDSTPLISGGILDSIATVKLVSHLEERFDVRFQAHEMSIDCLDSIDRIVATVNGKLGK